MTLPAPDHRDRLVWLWRGYWCCACNQDFRYEEVALTHAARCPVVANRRRFAEIRARWPELSWTNEWTNEVKA